MRLLKTERQASSAEENKSSLLLRSRDKTAPAFTEKF